MKLYKLTGLILALLVAVTCSVCAFAVEETAEETTVAAADAEQEAAAQENGKRTSFAIIAAPIVTLTGFTVDRIYKKLNGRWYTLGFSEEEIKKNKAKLAAEEAAKAAEATEEKE